MMTTQFRSFPVLVLLLLLVAGTLFATGGSEEPVAPPQASGGSGYLSDTSPITLDWYVDASWYTRARWGVDATSQYITEKTGVTLNIILPSGNEAERKNLMIATGDVPDIVSMGWWEGARQQMIDAGLLYSLDELAETYGTEFWDYTTASTVGWYRESDGKIYGYPNVNMPLERVDEPWNQAQLLSYVGFTVRKDLYEAIGSPDMTTPEGFLQALRDCARQFPTIDGLKTIPFTFAYPFTENGNLGIDDNLMELLRVPYVDENDQVISRRRHPELKRWLEVFRQATQEGLIPTEVFIDKTPQIQEAFETGRVFSASYAVNSLSGTVNGPLYQADPDSIYIQIEGPQNSRGELAQFPAGGLAGWLWTAMSRTNRDPERAFKFMMYWMSPEGQADFYLGDPSVTRTPSGDAILPEVISLRKTDENAWASRYGNMDNYFMLLDSSISNRWAPTDFEPWEQQFYEFQTGRLYANTVYQNLEPEPDTPAAVALTRSNIKWGTLLPRMLLAETSEEFETLYADFVSVDEAESRVYLPAMQEKYEQNVERLLN